MDNKIKKFLTLGSLFRILRRFVKEGIPREKTMGIKRGVMIGAKKIASHAPDILYFDYRRMNALFAEGWREELDNVLSLATEEDVAYYIFSFEEEFRRYIGARYACGTSSCTAALSFSLLALGIGNGDEVITVPNTYAATALAIADVGARPVFVDVKNDFTMDPAKLEEAITAKSRAIIPVHLYGMPCQMDAIMEIAKRRRLFVVEDAAQAHGSQFDDKKAGSFGDAGCFSLHPTKLIAGYGNGGILVSDRRDIYEKVRDLQDFHKDDAGLRTSRRTPDQLNPFIAAGAKIKLRKIDPLVRERNKIAAFYNERFRDIGQIKLPPSDVRAVSSYRNYTVICERRDDLMRHLLSQGIETRIFYPELLHRMKMFATDGDAPSGLPVSEYLNKRILSLPNGPYLSEEEVDRVAQKVRHFYRK